jgi:phage terminase small subunit
MIRYPQHLKKPGRQFYKKVLADFDLEEAHDLERLSLACECLDKIDDARQAVKDAGPFFTDRFGQPKEHPGQKTVRDNCVLFARLIRELCLDIEQPEEARPPRQY